MDATDARRHAIEAGLSDALRAAFNNVAEATAADGEPMFARGVSRDLAKAVVCRTYAPLVLQLGHLVNIADAAGDAGWEAFFFAGHRASAGAYRGTLDRRLAARGWRRGGFEAAAGSVTVRYEDGAFDVPYSRMPLLSALMYFLLETVGYAAAEEIFSNMLRNAARRDAVGDAANRMSRHLYDYLGDHLRPVQEQGKFERIVAFLKDKNGGAAIEIDDAVILDFWRAEIAARAESDFKQFRSAFRAFTAFAKAVEHGKRKGAVVRAAAIGGDREAGEISPDVLSDALEPEDDWQSPLPQLDAEPAGAIRFFTQRDQKDLTLLMELGPLALSWPLSLLRHETFGFTQSRLTQAARAGAPQAEIAEIASCADTEKFTERVARIGELELQVSDTLKASAWIVRRADGDAAVAGREDDALIDAQMMEARRAFKKINRRGFSEDAARDPEIVAGHRAGMSALLSVRDRIAQWHDKAHRLDNTPPGLGKQFEKDTICFKDGFRRLYGESA
jgi:hypothetical protein